jgi:uncharacterized protein (TIGR03437 family)
VTIPAGQSKATFQVAGNTVGVAEILATPADAVYETAFANLQVADSTTGLKVAVVSGGSQVAVPGQPLSDPVVLRVVDVNNLPYPGVKLNASVTAGGTVMPPSATTDESGTASFAWTPAAGSSNKLTAAIDNLPASAVTVTALSKPAFSAAGVVSSASYAHEIAPGSLASIFGSNLSLADADALTPRWPTQLAHVGVLLNGVAAKVTAVRESQINFMVPPSTPVGPAKLVVQTLVGNSDEVTVNVAPFAPGIFYDPPSGLGAILIANTGKKTDVLAAEAGQSELEIYGTGLGPVHADGNLFKTDSAVQVFVAGQPAQVLYSGYAGGYEGLYQVNAMMPAGVPSGPQRVSIEVGGKRSNEVLIYVR